MVTTVNLIEYGVKSEVPQEYPFDPLLFAVYINDLWGVLFNTADSVNSRCPNLIPIQAIFLFANYSNLTVYARLEKR